jgi:hypothetical protein
MHVLGNTRILNQYLYLLNNRWSSAWVLGLEHAGAIVCEWGRIVCHVWSYRCGHGLLHGTRLHFQVSWLKRLCRVGSLFFLQELLAL